MRRKPLKSPSSTQTGSFDLPRASSTLVLRTYFPSVPSLDDPYDPHQLSPHYTADNDTRLHTAVIEIPTVMSSEGQGKREVVFTSDGGSANVADGIKPVMMLRKPRTATSQSRFRVGANNTFYLGAPPREGITTWIKEYFRFPEKRKPHFRRKKTASSLSHSFARLPTLQTRSEVRTKLTRIRTETNWTANPQAESRQHKRSATMLK